MRKFSVFLCTLWLFLSCTDFPSRFDRLDGNKIRSLTVVCEPVEASPGDTVHVRLVGEFPDGVPPIQWTVAFDFREDQSANDAYEREVVPVEALNYVPDSLNPDLAFSFVIPDTALLLATTFTQNPFIAQAGLSPDSLNRLLLSLPPDSSLPPELNGILSYLGARLKLRAHMVQGITLDVTKLVSVRLLRRFGLSDCNKNPATPGKISVVKVKSDKPVDPDSVESYPNEITDLSVTGTGFFPQSRTPGLNPDTVLIESGYQYFVKVDTVLGTRQVYNYLSIRTGLNVVDSENISYAWFSQNLDEAPGMVRDSLVLFTSGGFRAKVLRGFLPSVNTALHSVRFHIVLRDARPSDPLDAAGTAYRWAEVYFKYSAEYERKHPQ